MYPQKLNRDGSVKERPARTVAPDDDDTDDVPTVPEVMDIEDVIDGMDSANSFVRDTCRDYVDRWITPVTPEVERLRKQNQSLYARRKYKNEHAKKQRKVKKQQKWYLGR